jgi:hypothetical protein
VFYQRFFSYVFSVCVLPALKTTAWKIFSKIVMHVYVQVLVAGVKNKISEIDKETTLNFN